jgi:hypothetical protein
VPCSFGLIGKSTLGCIGCSSVTCSSTPDGERESSRTVPTSVTLASWVSVRNPAHVSSDTSRLATTPCTVPEPSRTTRKAILPLERVVTTQPRRVTDSPMWRGSSLM